MVYAKKCDEITGLDGNFFLLQFLVIKALDPDWIRIRIGLTPQDLDPEKMNTDPKHCKKAPDPRHSC